MKFFFSLCFGALMVFGACSSQASKALNPMTSQTQDIDQIVWRNWGPPLAPQYNNTYIITLSRTQQTLTIDSVRTAGIEITRKLSIAEFDQILKLKTQHHIEIGSPLENDGCVGGAGHTLTFLRKGVKLTEGFIINCAGKERSNINGNFYAFTQAISKLAFPK